MSSIWHHAKGGALSRGGLAQTKMLKRGLIRERITRELLLFVDLEIVNSLSVVVGSFPMPSTWKQLRRSVLPLQTWARLIEIVFGGPW